MKYFYLMFFLIDFCCIDFYQHNTSFLSSGFNNYQNNKKKNDKLSVVPVSYPSFFKCKTPLLNEISIDPSSSLRAKNLFLKNIGFFLPIKLFLQGADTDDVINVNKSLISLIEYNDCSFFIKTMPLFEKDRLFMFLMFVSQENNEELEYFLLYPYFPNKIFFQKKIYLKKEFLDEHIPYIMGLLGENSLMLKNFKTRLEKILGLKKIENDEDDEDEETLARDVEFLIQRYFKSIKNKIIEMINELLKKNSKEIAIKNILNSRYKFGERELVLKDPAIFDVIEERFQYVSHYDKHDEVVYKNILKEENIDPDFFPGMVKKLEEILKMYDGLFSNIVELHTRVILCEDRPDKIKKAKDRILDNLKKKSNESDEEYIKRVKIIIIGLLASLRKSKEAWFKLINHHFKIY